MSLPVMRAVQALGAAYFTKFPDTARVRWALLPRSGAGGMRNGLVIRVPRRYTARIPGFQDCDLGYRSFSTKTWFSWAEHVIENEALSACMVLLFASETNAGSRHAVVAACHVEIRPGTWGSAGEQQTEWAACSVAPSCAVVGSSTSRWGSIAAQGVALAGGHQRLPRAVPCRAA